MESFPITLKSNDPAEVRDMGRLLDVLWNAAERHLKDAAPPGSDYSLKTDRVGGCLLGRFGKRFITLAEMTAPDVNGRVRIQQDLDIAGLPPWVSPETITKIHADANKDDRFLP